MISLDGKIKIINEDNKYFNYITPNKHSKKKIKRFSNNIR